MRRRFELHEHCIISSVLDAPLAVSTRDSRCPLRVHARTQQ
jgi:hypothetical protein